MENPVITQATPPIEDELMRLARLGAIKEIQALFDSGKYDANSSDAQGITPLHWAAYNNHLPLVHFLLTSGADPNARGGDAHATPLLWSSRRSHLAIMQILLSFGANPLLIDDAGYNILHCATLDGNLFQLVFLLSYNQKIIPVDCKDSQGHTSLMWAAYKGHSSCVELLLRYGGADVEQRDEGGFTALHWGLVKGDMACVRRLIEYGSDVEAKTNDGKTPEMVAKEMNSTLVFQRALVENGLDVRGGKSNETMAMLESMGVKDRKKFIWTFFLCFPFIAIGVMSWFLTFLHVYFAIPSVLISGLGIYLMTLKVLSMRVQDFSESSKTPFLAGIFAGTLTWVGILYTFQILTSTIRIHPFLNIAFIFMFILCTRFYFSAMCADPGYIPKPSSRQQVKTVVEELINKNAFNERHFCTSCMIRKPMRSRHCKQCRRCIGRTDHHCPWVDNCVGINNHRHFVLYLVTLFMGIILYVRLFSSYIIQLVDDASGSTSTCNILPLFICKYYSKSPFITLITGWTALQLSWTFALLVVQLSQIARGITTYEALRGHTIGPVTSALTTGSLDPVETAGTIPLAESSSDSRINIQQPGTGDSSTSTLLDATDPFSPLSPNENSSPSKSSKVKNKSITTSFAEILGLTTVIQTLSVMNMTRLFGGRKKSPSSSSRVTLSSEEEENTSNVFSSGIFNNWTDFWYDAPEAIHPPTSSSSSSSSQPFQARNSSSFTSWLKNIFIFAGQGGRKKGFGPHGNVLIKGAVQFSGDLSSTIPDENEHGDNDNDDNGGVGQGGRRKVISAYHGSSTGQSLPENNGVGRLKRQRVDYFTFYELFWLNGQDRKGSIA